ncbi:MAG: arsenic resistance N-acetyltransferase ArsN2 [Woeseia sp.]
MTETVKLRPAAATDLQDVTELLQDAGLPIDDLRSELLHEFVVAGAQGGGLVGAIGLQRFGETALLRSLVTDVATRGKGLGTRLLRALEDRARASGIRDLWLLTIDADGFFARHNYSAENRTDVPEVIAGTTEFSALCPATAHLMRKRLENPAA